MKFRFYIKFNIIYIILFSLMQQCKEVPPEDDLGVFLKKDKDNFEEIKYDFFEKELSLKCDEGFGIRISGKTLQTTPKSPYGEPIGEVKIRVFNFFNDNSPIAEVISDKEGNYFIDLCLQDEMYLYFWLKKQGFPETVQFDRTFFGTTKNFKLRLFSSILIKAPMQILKQNSELGYIQGSVYNYSTEETIKGVVIKSSSGEVVYLNDKLLIPDKKLKQTTSNGAFFVVNTDIGEVVLRAYLNGDLIKIQKVKTWKGGIVSVVGMGINCFDADLPCKNLKK